MKWHNDCGTPRVSGEFKKSPLNSPMRHKDAFGLLLQLRDYHQITNTLLTYDLAFITKKLLRESDHRRVYKDNYCWSKESGKDRRNRPCIPSLCKCLALRGSTLGKGRCIELHERFIFYFKQDWTLLYQKFGLLISKITVYASGYCPHRKERPTIMFQRHMVWGKSKSISLFHFLKLQLIQ